MIVPKSLVAAVSAFLALEGYSLLTAPGPLVREAVERARARKG